MTTLVARRTPVHGGWDAAADHAEIEGNTEKLHGGGAAATRLFAPAVRLSSSARSTSEMAAALADALSAYLLDVRAALRNRTWDP